MKEDFTTESFVKESFERITLTEFDNRMRRAWPWRIFFGVTILIAMVSVLAVLFLGTAQLYGYALLALVLLIVSVYPAVFLYKYSIRQFGLCCPYCKKPLQRDFESLKTCIRRKGKFFRERNVFISGKCTVCENSIIQADPELNRCLRERNARKKTGSFMSTVCLLLGMFAFFWIINTNLPADKDRHQKSEKIDIYSARRQIGEGSFQQAKATLVQILARQPNYSTAQKLLGYIYLQEDDPEKALDHYQKARSYSEDPNQVDTVISLICQRMKDKQ